MKKLMIAAAIVCAAAISHAAAVDWQASAVYNPWETASQGKNVAASGWLGYCVLAADLSTVTTDLAKGDTASLLSSAVGPIKTSTSQGKFALGTASGSVSAGTQDFYLIVLNNGDAAKADYFYVSDAVSATVDASLDTSVSFGTQATKSKPVANWTAMSVPEPTSGLLLLLGMAGLALRRRHA